MVLAELRKLDANGSVVYTMVLRNMEVWELNLSFPVIATPLPEEDATEQILIKIMGNHSDTKFSWIVKDETTAGSVIAEDATVKTLPQQLEFWRTKMRPQSIVDEFTLTIKFPTDMVFEGTINIAKFHMDKSTPNSMLGSFTFMEGKVNGGTYELDAPSVPLSVTVSSPLAGQLRQDWGDATDPGSSNISFYKFEYRLQGSAAWINIDVAASSNDHTKTGLTAGTYEARMRAANTHGNSQPSPILIQVVA